MGKISDIRKDMPPGAQEGLSAKFKVSRAAISMILSGSRGNTSSLAKRVRTEAAILGALHKWNFLHAGEDCMIDPKIALECMDIDRIYTKQELVSQVSELESTLNALKGILKNT